MKKLSISWSYFFQKFIWKAFFVVFILFAFLANSLHESYPDEFDNILGGWDIIHGKLIYSGFFTHHGPVPYFMAAVIELFSGQSFVHFRIIYGGLLFAFLFGVYFLLKKRLGSEKVSFFPFFIAFLGIESTYYWAQMLLADNVAAFSFLPVYALILLKVVFKKPIELLDIGIISFFSAIALYSSLTYTYLYIIIVVSALYLFYKDNPIKKVFSIENVYPILIFAAPHTIFGLYLLVTNSLQDYIYQNFVFNTKYYIYNYPRSGNSDFINPMRYAILIIHWFFMNFYTLLIGVMTFGFTFPVNMTMAVGDVAIFIYLLFKKHYKLAAFVLLVVIFTNVRSDPLKSKETDYQSGVYNMLSFFNIFFVLPQLYSDINGKVESAKKVVFGILIFFVGIYGFFGLMNLVYKFNDKVVSKYMGTQALIYDRPQLAPVLNVVASKDEYVWAGPFEFEELFYTNAKLPSKYQILIAGIADGDKTRNEMLADFDSHMPMVIFFDKSFVYLGNPVVNYGSFFIDFLNKNYITLLDYKKGNIEYRSIPEIGLSHKLDLEAKLYIRKDAVDDVVAKLLANNYIKAVPVK